MAVTTDRRLFLPAIITLLSLAGMGVAGLEIARVRSRRALLDAGARAMGTVTQVRPEPWYSTVGSFVDYRFEAGGRSWEIQRRVCECCVGALKPGQPITVFHDPADPARCVSEGERHLLTAGWRGYAVWWGLCFIAPLLWSVPRLWRALRRRDPAPGAAAGRPPSDARRPTGDR